MRRHVFAVDPFGNAAASDGAALRNYDGALYVTQTRTYASPTNLRIGAAGQPAEEGALVRRAALRGCGDVTVHIIDRLLPEPSAEFNGVLYTNMERLLPVEPPQCTPLLAALRTIKGASTFLASDRIHVRAPPPADTLDFTNRDSRWLGGGVPRRRVPTPCIARCATPQTSSVWREMHAVMCSAAAHGPFRCAAPARARTPQAEHDAHGQGRRRVLPRAC